jgi:hypothetical protein
MSGACAETTKNTGPIDSANNAGTHNASHPGVGGASGTTITFRNAVGDTADRIVATVDTNGNRSSISYNLN